MNSLGGANLCAVWYSKVKVIRGQRTQLKYPDHHFINRHLEGIREKITGKPEKVENRWWL